MAPVIYEEYDLNVEIIFFVIFVHNKQSYMATVKNFLNDDEKIDMMKYTL
ncbi:hypothetical protein [Halalkalibacter krulwichiae]|nr:hypothetical protein [Halalkalibacter krulwichiae]